MSKLILLWSFFLDGLEKLTQFDLKFIFSYEFIEFALEVTSEGQIWIFAAPVNTIVTALVFIIVLLIIWSIRSVSYYM